MIELTILVPSAALHADNFHSRHEWEEILTRTFGGFTRTAPVNGSWRGEEEGMWPYVVGVAGLIAWGNTVEKLASRCKALFGQNRVYVSYLGQSEIL